MGGWRRGPDSALPELAMKRTPNASQPRRTNYGFRAPFFSGTSTHCSSCAGTPPIFGLGPSFRAAAILHAVFGVFLRTPTRQLCRGLRIWRFGHGDFCRPSAQPPARHSRSFAAIRVRVRPGKIRDCRRFRTDPTRIRIYRNCTRRFSKS